MDRFSMTVDAALRTLFVPAHAAPPCPTEPGDLTELTAAEKAHAGAVGLGLIAGRLGDEVSLGFVVETENQVEAHLQSHLSLLPTNDHASRAIVAQMKDDEARHALEARQAGAMELPGPVKGLMRVAAKVMTTVAHRV
jgi:ubiquinone biosynthesis monooxygenase Coq7